MKNYIYGAAASIVLAGCQSNELVAGVPFGADQLKKSIYDTRLYLESCDPDDLSRSGVEASIAKIIGLGAQTFVKSAGNRLKERGQAKQDYVVASQSGYFYYPIVNPDDSTLIDYQLNPAAQCVHLVRGWFDGEAEEDPSAPWKQFGVVGEPDFYLQFISSIGNPPLQYGSSSQDEDDSAAEDDTLSDEVATDDGDDEELEEQQLDVFTHFQLKPLYLKRTAPIRSGGRDRRQVEVIFEYYQDVVSPLTTFGVPISESERELVAIGNPSEDAVIGIAGIAFEQLQSNVELGPSVFRNLGTEWVALPDPPSNTPSLPFTLRAWIIETRAENKALTEFGSFLVDSAAPEAKTVVETIAGRALGADSQIKDKATKRKAVTEKLYTLKIAVETLKAVEGGSLTERLTKEKDVATGIVDLREALTLSNESNAQAEALLVEATSLLSQ